MAPSFLCRECQDETEVISNWISTRKAVVRITAAALCLLLIPYTYSRLAAGARRIRIQTIPAVTYQADAAERSTVRVATYNIAHGRGCTDVNFNGESETQRFERLDAIASLLSEVDADIVILNEVDFDASWSGHVDQASYLAKRAGYRYVAKERNLDFRILGWTWCFGNAVLSKHPIRQAQEIDLPSYSAWETILAGKKRGLNCVVSHSLQGDIRILAAHLSPRSEALRIKSVKQLIGITRESDVPTVLAGDLNSAPPAGQRGSSQGGSSSDLNAIIELDASELFTRSPLVDDASGLTFPADAPRQAIDWIFAPVEAKLVNHRVIASELSDHRPVVADIELPSR
jgi:endonuclease/exonuclease/phosphatase family metal-dependent hydrolase